MSIEKKQELISTEVVGKWKKVRVRIDTVILENGKEISRIPHRHQLNPNSDITNELADVQSICNVVWTDKHKEQYNLFISSSQN